MSKKNKDIQVQVTEEERVIDGKKQAITQLMIGKKLLVKLFQKTKIFKPIMMDIF